jgi:hypothetical protein
MERMYSEDAMMIAGNILSGDNACGSLQKAVATADPLYFAAAAEAVLKAGRAELENARNQREEAAKMADQYRFVVELLVQNLYQAGPSPDVLGITVNGQITACLEKALGRKMFWNRS